MKRRAFVPSKVHIGISTVIGAFMFAVGLLAYHSVWTPWLILKSGCDNVVGRNASDVRGTTWHCVAVNSLSLTSGLITTHGAFMIFSTAWELLPKVAATQGHVVAPRFLIGAAHSICGALLIVANSIDALHVFWLSRCADRQMRAALWFHTFAAPFYDGGRPAVSVGVNLQRCVAHDIDRSGSQQWLDVIGLVAAHSRVRLGGSVYMWYCGDRRQRGALTATCVPDAIDMNEALARFVLCYYAVLVAVQFYLACRVAVIYYRMNTHRSKCGTSNVQSVTL